MPCSGWTSTYRVEQGATHWSFLAQVERHRWIFVLSGDSQSSLVPWLELFGVAEEKDRVFTGDLLPVPINSAQSTRLFVHNWLNESNRNI